LLGQVAGPGRGLRVRAGVACRVLAGVMGPVALIERAGLRVLDARRAARLLGIGGARLARDAGATLGEVALACGGPAHSAAGCNDIGRTALARSVAGLGGIAHVARAGATHEAARPHGVRGTTGARPRAG